MVTNDLIKTVLSLDQSGPGENGETLQSLWISFESTPASELHAAEESSLRWLLKSMNGPTAAAENLRRYPTTWMILGHAFDHIPPVSLAKSLADRRFVTVFQQTLQDVSQPVAGADGQSGQKSKEASTFHLETLRSRSGCLETGKQIFEASRRLIRRVSGTRTTSHDNIGAEHIKSLFRTSSTEAMKILVPGLNLCQLFIVDDGRTYEPTLHEHWVATLVKIWDLHLPGNEDITDIATHLFTPMLALRHDLNEILNSGSAQKEDGPGSSMVGSWVLELDSFLHRYFILPARASFLRNQELGPITMALDVSEGKIDKIAYGLYSLVASAPALKTYHRRGNEWANRIFQAVESTLRTHKDGENILGNIIEEAIRRSMPIEVEELRAVCRRYGLRKESTNWSVVAACAKCNPGIFQTSKEGAELRNDICRTISQAEYDQDLLQPVVGVIQALVDGYCTARDFAGFLMLWYQQLCIDEDNGRHASDSYWLRAAMKLGKEGTFVSLPTYIERYLSEGQLLKILDGLAHIEKHPQALCIFAASVAEGVQSDGFVDAVDKKLLRLVNDIETKRAGVLIRGLRWRVVSQTIKWVEAVDRDDIWSSIQVPLSKVLQKSAINSLEVFEAFKCCGQAWLSMYPDDARLSEPAKMIDDFIKRLEDELATFGTPEFAFLYPGFTPDIDPGFTPDIDPGFAEKTALWQYLEWQIKGASRLRFLRISDKAPILSILPLVFTTENVGPATIMHICQSVIQNEVLINDLDVISFLIDYQVGCLAEEFDPSSTWLKAKCCLSTLSSLPFDCFSRAQRETVIGVLIKQRDVIFRESPAQLPSDEVVIQFLTLLTRMTTRPAFHGSYDFRVLGEIADAMGSFYTGFSFATNERPDAPREILEHYRRLAQSVVRQMASKEMATEDDERSRTYFTQATEYCNRIRKSSQSEATPQPSTAFRLTLLQVLSSELKGTTGSKRNFLLETHDASILALQDLATNVFREAIKAFQSFDSVSGTMNLFALMNVTELVPNMTTTVDYAEDEIREFVSVAEKEEATPESQVKHWKMKAFLYNYFSSDLIDARPRHFGLRTSTSLPMAPESLMKYCVTGILKQMTKWLEKRDYFEILVKEYVGDHQTLEQLYVMRLILDDLTETSDDSDDKLNNCLSNSFGILVPELRNLKTTSELVLLTDLLANMLEKRQSLGQWNVESTLATVCEMMASQTNQDAGLDLSRKSNSLRFSRACALVQRILMVREHRRHLEARFHLLLSALQSLLRALVFLAQSPSNQRQPVGKAPLPQGQNLVEVDQEDPESELSDRHLAQQFARLITLICEPSAAAVSRLQKTTSSLDSDTAVAKRYASNHMYLLLMHYVKLQLETTVSSTVREVLEPAIHSILAITPEGSGSRGILYGAMDSNGRAILSEMISTYGNSGKWTGV